MDEKIVIGWREWFSFPALGLKKIKGKIDTGARTSALHAFEVEPYRDKDVEMVRFLMHPKQNDTDYIKECHAQVHDERWVTDSGGHRELRYVIQTDIQLGHRVWPIEMTLTNRDTMKFRMLLGRTAMTDILVDPGASYLQKKSKSGKETNNRESL